MAIDIESIVFPGSANEYQLRDTRVDTVNTEITNIKNYDGYGTTLDTVSQNLAGAVNELKSYDMIIATTDPLTTTVGKIGQLYFNTTTNGLFSCVDFEDPDYIWAPVSSGATVLGVNFPLGGYIYLSAPQTPPTGFLPCDGRAISRTVYKDLFALIGTTYGAGDGSTTFNIPDFDDTDLFICAVKYLGELTAGPGIVINENTISVSSPLFAQLPVGAKIFWETGNAVPTGYLRCKGQAVSRTTYSELFALWGTTYGSGDGSTTFNVPNFADNDLIVRAIATQGEVPAFTWYTPEDVENKVTSWSSTPSDIKYPSEKLVKDSLDNVDVSETQTITETAQTITAKDNLRVLLNISGTSTAALSDGTETTQKVEIVNISSDKCTLSYKGNSGATTFEMSKDSSIRLLWIGSYWEASEDVPVLGIDDNKTAFAFNIDSMVKSGETVHLTGKDANGTSFEYGIENLITKCEEQSYSTTEVKTNMTWINGKPIYRKVMNYTTDIVGTGSQQTLALGTINNIDTAVILTGTYLANTNQASIPYISSGGQATLYVTNGGQVNMIHTTSSSVTIHRVSVTVLYTKTTD